MKSDFTKEEWENLYAMATSKDEGNKFLALEMLKDTKNEADLVLYDFLKDVGNSDTRIMGKLSNLEDIKLCEFILSKFLMMKMQWYFSFSSFKAESITVKLKER
jgi:hypothetical protein